MTRLPESLESRLVACALTREGQYHLRDRWVGELHCRGLLESHPKKPLRSILTVRGWRYYRMIAPLLEGLDMKRMVRADVRRARLMLDKTQQEMADAIGCHLMTYGRWERKGELPPLAEEKLRSLLVEKFPQLRGAA